MQDPFIPRLNSPLRQMVEKLNREWAEIEAQKEAQIYLEGFVDGACRMAEQMEGLRNDNEN